MTDATATSTPALDADIVEARQPAAVAEEVVTDVQVNEPKADEPQVDETQYLHSCTEEEVKLTPEPTSDYDGPLRGFLTIPKDGNGPFPAAVLVPGSGSVDADATLGVNRPYRDLARSLSNSGVIVVRADKPTVGKGLRQFPQATLAWEYIEPIISSLRLLMQHPKVDKKKVYILGHSLGGDVVPKAFLKAAAAGYDQLAGMLMLCTGGRKLHHIAVFQISNSASTETDEKKKEWLTGMAEKFRRQSEYIDTKLTGLEPNDPEDGPDSMMFGASGAYCMDIRDLDPVQDVKDVITMGEARGNPVKTFIAHGGNDFQVLYDLDFKVFEDAFKETPGITLRVWEGVNHILSKSTNLTPDNEYDGRHEVDQDLVKDLSDWIKAP